MPTYSYRCTECGEAFDIQQSFTDDSLTVCPNCGGPLRKLFNTVGVTFNGSGFYRTDSRPTPKSEGGESSAGPSESSGPSESAGSSAPTGSSSGPAAASGPSASLAAKKESKSTHSGAKE